MAEKYVCNLLKNLRKDAGLTQKELADKVGVTNSTISFYEQEERSPSVDMIIRLSKIFNVSVDYLLGIDQKRNINLSGLKEEDIQLIQCMVEHLKNKKVQTYSNDPRS
ncbi:MAG: helix-turn-helix transcriptional regulator [Eubacterium sp.]|jgi:transcriptional regulator with XRE-family HTH domain|nr:helix-turn-helix transcriptional regulator [Eubacterium sp.]